MIQILERHLFAQFATREVNNKLEGRVENSKQIPFAIIGIDTRMVAQIAGSQPEPAIFNTSFIWNSPRLYPIGCEAQVLYNSLLCLLAQSFLALIKHTQYRDKDYREETCQHTDTDIRCNIGNKVSGYFAVGLHLMYFF